MKTSTGAKKPFLVLALFLITLGVQPLEAKTKHKKPALKRSQKAAKKTSSPIKVAAPKPEPERAVAAESSETEMLRGKLFIPEIASAKDDSKMLRQIHDLILKNNPASNPWFPPGNSVAIPTGYGAGWSELFAGGVLTSPATAGGKYDTAIFAGLGLGDPRQTVGVDLALGIYSVIPFGRSGGVSLRLHRQLGQGFAAALGVENLIGWENGSGRSFYGVGSKTFQVQQDERKFLSSLHFHLGVGNGRFSTASALLDGRTNVNAFGGVGARLFQPLGAALSWNGQDIVAGVTVTPFRRIPVFLGFSVSDFVVNPEHNQPRITATYTWGDSWDSDTFMFKAFKDM